MYHWQTHTDPVGEIDKYLSECSFQLIILNVPSYKTVGFTLYRPKAFHTRQI